MESNESEQIITCPNCGEKIPLTKALMGHIEADLKKQFQAEYDTKIKVREKKIKEETEKSVTEKYETNLQDLQNQVSEQDKKLKEMANRELELNKKERELSDKERSIQLEVSKQVKSQVFAIEQKIKDDAEKTVAEKFEMDVKTLENKIAEKDKRIKEFNQREQELTQKENDLNNKKLSLEKEYENKLNKAKETIITEEKQRAKEEVLVEISDIKSQLDDYKDKYKKAQQQEIELRKSKNQLETDREEFELKKQREIDTAKKEISQKVKSEAEAQYKLEARDKDLELEQLKNQIKQLKSQQGSQQIKGESQELELEEFLSTQFIYDRIEPVPKGFRGGDVIQTVKTKFGEESGKIIWESKRTKNWGNDWITKLKEDRREAKADIAVIVSQILPEGVNSISQQEGVWIVNFESIHGIAIALREQLLQIDQIKKSQVGKNEKMEVVYDYLCSNEFRQKIEGIVEAFITMRNDLESEKRAINKQWQKREVQIDKVLKNTTGMFGGLQALIGNSLPEIKELEMPEEHEEESHPSLSEGNEDLPF
ncbi:MAG: DUF2130 domain-containing protein [Bacteroidetes bacterium]|nr:DUF2130 domain-containing protein [Bacteroidota bacterium]